MVHQPDAIVIESHEGVAGIDPNAWDRLVGDGSPFMEHAFLVALEDTGCVGEGTGWFPIILTATRGQQLVGAVPMYIKTHSRGEFVFDWAWADAAQRAGLPYYPKAVVAVPFTPVTGVRLLVDESFEAANELRHALATSAMKVADEMGLSSVHFNFIQPEEVAIFEDLGVAVRAGIQYHWSNPAGEQAYKTFDDYLARLKSKKRANIRRERRLLAEKGVQSQVYTGDDIGRDRMRRMYQYYLSTVHKFFWGHQYLNEDFFMALYETHRSRLHIAVAAHNGEEFAGAFNLVKGDRLFGRYWGCTKEVEFTHFEVCMYTSIEWCIANDVRFFEPGAGGEHKFSRGFEATHTYSAHHISDPQLEDAIRQFVGQERNSVDRHVEVLNDRGPFKG